MTSEMEMIPEESLVRGMILRIAVKGLCLFILFNVVYGLFQPVQNGLLPTLYNVLFPGRLRFKYDYEFDAYRMVSDHIISEAKPDTFNIAFLGSSEIWGARVAPAQTIPAFMDAIGMTTTNGDPVRVYNLGYPFPYAFKDLIILEAANQYDIPIDLVILSTFGATLTLGSAPHAVASANASLETYVVEHYRLPSKYLDATTRTQGDYEPVFLPEWNDRANLAVWGSMQMRGILWSILRDDIDSSTAHLRQLPPSMTAFVDNMTPGVIRPEPEMLAAFARFHQETGIPVLILAAPVPAKENTFALWLQEQTRVVGLPLLDCWQVFRDPAMFESIYHIIPAMHGQYAGILAKQLTDAALASDIPGLPLRLPHELVQPVESCEFFPSQK